MALLQAVADPHPSDALPTFTCAPRSISSSATCGDTELDVFRLQMGSAGDLGGPTDCDSLVLASPFVSTRCSRHESLRRARQHGVTTESVVHPAEESLESYAYGMIPQILSA